MKSDIGAQKTSPKSRLTSGAGKAIDKDAVTLINHGQRIKHLEAARS